MELEPDMQLVLTSGSGYIGFPQDTRINRRYRGKVFHFTVEFPYPELGVNRDLKEPSLKLNGVESRRGYMKSNIINYILEQKHRLLFANYAIV